ncbi:hypothetical protein ICL16_00260 [Iningainema sp. BLCCT55]|uniref:Tox-PL-2 domain-containing protein n=1 Tax=Iningainema tapete BLCC-T55 TaxID=2748662 RepID=A0A8J7C5B4_9CYAN|nr:hypothetical protein [Iningainema tapete BLCC-T55]
MIEIRLEQIQQVRAIASKYKNFECVECTIAIKDYLISQKLNGKQIKLYTGSGIGRDSYIYDDSVPSDAISINGRHQAISIYNNEVEIIFDNHHPDGIPKTQWMANLQFHGKIYYGREFQITEEYF